MPFILAQSEQLTDFQRAVRDEISEGGSISAFVLAIAAILLLLLLVYVAVRCQRWMAAAKETRNTPKRLFAALLDKLQLDRDEREWLTQAATAAGLRHPTVLLLSEQLFDEQAASRSGQSRPGKALDLAPLRRRLFPEAAPANPLRPLNRS